jgi:NRPS condensation-like uncharacterized protein
MFNKKYPTVEIKCKNEIKKYLKNKEFTLENYSLTLISFSIPFPLEVTHDSAIYTH